MEKRQHLRGIMLYVLTIILSLVAVKYLFLTAPFVPAKKQDLERLAALVGENKIKNLCDLGCGTGRVINYLSKKYPEKIFTGIELSLWSLVTSKIRFLSRENVQVIWGNFFWCSWDNFEAVYLFWRPETISKYRQKMEIKMKTGQYVLSYCFEVDFLKNKLIKIDKQDRRLPIYVYKI